MADWNEIADSELVAGQPLNTSLFSRLARNPQAIAEGAAGAPGIQVEALVDLVAGDVQRYLDPTTYTMSEITYATAWSTALVQRGTVRLRFEHSGHASSYGIATRVLVAGVVQGEWTYASTSWATRTIDLTFERGDTIVIQHRATDTFSRSHPRLRNVELLTDGVLILPLAPDTKWKLT